MRSEKGSNGWHGQDRIASGPARVLVVAGSLCFALMQFAVAEAKGASSVSFPVVEDGKPVVEVVVAGDHETLAAAIDDLKTYVQRITGAALTVTKGTDDRPGPTLHLGETVLFEKTAPARKAIRGDGFVMAKLGEDLLIAGNLPQGTANGVWTVLQDQFGVRWYYAGPLWEIVPEKKSLAITFEPNAGDGACLENPSFIERALWGGHSDNAFGRRVRLTDKNTPLPYVGTSHHLSQVVNPTKFADHPDYFAYYDGRRHVEHDVHPCFTHPDMFDVFMDYVRKGGSSFGVNDNLTACKCDRRLALDGKSEPYMGIWNFSESYFQLMARVAAQTAKEFPGRRLGVFAYQLTDAPPKTVPHIGDNVDVVLCQDTAQYFDPQYKGIDQAMSAEWVTKCGHVRFYDYVGINFWTPRYFPHILADQLKHLRRVGVAGYGTHSVSMPDSSMPLFYLLYRMLWNADLDPDQLINEMIGNLYAESAGPMRQFYDHWEQCWTRQKKGRWFWGMDNFRGEMQAYTPADIERGQQLLDEAAGLAKSQNVRQRIDWLRERYAFTRDSARAHFVSTDAIQSVPPADHEQAIAMSNRVADAWRTWVDRFEAVQQSPGPSLWGWIDKTFRVRAWGLKQQMRDAALAPLVRWAVANEGQIEPQRLRFIERTLAGVAIVNRQDIEERLTNQVEGHYRKPRADGLLVADIPRAKDPIELTCSPADWPGVPRVDAVPWVFRARPADQNTGKYEEPMPQNYVDPPPPDDQSMTWQAAWDDQRLYLRIVVTDKLHEQTQPPESIWKEDSVQIALNPRRDDFLYDRGSWDYIWGGYHRQEAEFGISLRDDTTQVYVWRTPPGLGDKADASSMIQAKAARHGPRTIYETAVDFKLSPGFKPAPERSFGICVVVNDADHGQRRSTEYGSGVCHAKRPTEFAALRLVAP